MRPKRQLDTDPNFVSFLQAALGQGTLNPDPQVHLDQVNDPQLRESGDEFLIRRAMERALRNKQLNLRSDTTPNPLNPVGGPAGEPLLIPRAREVNPEQFMNDRQELIRALRRRPVSM